MWIFLEIFHKLYCPLVPISGISLNMTNILPHAVPQNHPLQFFRGKCESRGGSTVIRMCASWPAHAVSEFSGNPPRSFRIFQRGQLSAPSQTNQQSLSALHTLHVNSLTRTGTIHSTFTQSSKPWTTHVNLHSDTVLVFQRTTVLFYRNKGQSHSGQIPFSTCCDAPWEMHASWWLMWHWGIIWSRGAECQIPDSPHFCARLVHSNQFCIWHERLELAVTSLHIQREAGQCSSAHFGGSSSVFVAISNGLQFIYEIVMWGIQ